MTMFGSGSAHTVWRAFSLTVTCSLPYIVPDIPRVRTNTFYSDQPPPGLDIRRLSRIAPIFRRTPSPSFPYGNFHSLRLSFLTDLTNLTLLRDHLPFRLGFLPAFSCPSLPTAWPSRIPHCHLRQINISSTGLTDCCSLYSWASNTSGFLTASTVQFSLGILAANMPPFFDRSQLQNAITARALPALEVLAANADRLDSSLDNRFARDDPPPYFSSESEEEDVSYHHGLVRPREAVIRENKQRLREPLDDKELRAVTSHLNSDLCYTPGKRFRREAWREEQLLIDFFWLEARRFESLPPYTPSPFLNSFLKGRVGRQKRAIIARRNVRKRWQRLGIWNPSWGIPGRVNAQPNDNVDSWKWKWQSDNEPPPMDPRHPITRAVQLRKGMVAGESAAPPPRSHLADDASASEAESFIISRPWFMYVLEQLEFQERMLRIPMLQWGNYSEGEDDQVTKWWKERGDYRDEWRYENRLIPGWKWRHESPSPEPEDLTPLLTDEMDFTPSEIDALEAIPPPTPPPPPPAVTKRDRPLFWVSDEDEASVSNAPDSADGLGHADAERRDGSMAADEEFEVIIAPPQPRRRGRPRKTQEQPNEVQHQRTSAAAAPGPVRRSARIAAMTATVALSPPVSGQPTRKRKRTEGPAALEGVEAPKRKRGRPPKTAKATAAKEEDVELTKTKRGRPRKTGVEATTAEEAEPPKRKRGRPQKTADTAAAKEVVEVTKKKRGRPRKTEGAASKPTAAVSAKKGRKPKPDTGAKMAAVAAAAAGKRGRGRPRRAD
ncbi:hypothetical protein VTK26DRAFT_7392 [Humicola hyalothermophila]